MRTLIVIDAQNDFMPGGSLAVDGGDLIVPAINSIQNKFELIVASQDWHPENHISFVSSNPGTPRFQSININGIKQTIWPDHCVQGTKGAEFHSDLETNKWEAIFRKGTDINIDSYSAFYDNGKQKSTGLAGYLKNKRVMELYFCGLAADICVYYSIKDAIREGFRCIVIEDATKPLDEEEYDRQKAELISMGVGYSNSERLLNLATV